MHHSRAKTTRPIHLLVGLAVVASGFVAAPTIVQADQFSPLPNPPVVAITEAPAASFAASIQPNYTRSSVTYSVSATITTNATLAALNTVSMCWYKASAGTDTLCTTTPNPQNAFQMVWTEATAAAANAGAGSGTAGFAVIGTNAYSDAGSQTPATGTASYDSTAQAMTIKFAFQVSNAMLAGSDWAVKVTAVYDDNLCGASACPAEYTLADRTGSDIKTGRFVAYWGEMTTAREQLAFGALAPNFTSNAVTAEAFAFVANAPSDFTMTATDFTHDPDGAGGISPDVIFMTTGSPGIKRARLDCRAAAGQTNANTSFVPLEPQNVSLGATVVPTGETINTAGTILCTLQYGSGAQYALREYSNSVTLALVQSPSGATVPVDPADEARDTIQEAINAANTGDIVVVPAGSFTENLNINKRITLRCANAGISAGAATPTPGITRGNETNITGQAVVSAAGVEIDGCRFVRPTVGELETPKLVSSSGVSGIITVRNSIFDFTIVIGETDSASCGSGTHGSAAWRVINNSFIRARYSTSCIGASGYFSRAVWAESSPKIIVAGNSFFSTGQSIFHTGTSANGSEIINNLFSGAGNGGVFLGAPKNTLIKGNTFEGSAGVYAEGAVGTTVENNSFDVPQSVFLVGAGTSATNFRFNQFLGAFPSGRTFFNRSSNSVGALFNYWGAPPKTPEVAIGLVDRTGLDNPEGVSFSPWIASFTAGNNPDTRYTTGFWPTGIVEGR